MSEFTDRIKRIIVSKEPSQTGVYCVTLCVNGLWQDIILDDFIPFSPQSGEFAYNTSKQPEIWVSLLQKAWAKVHGGYMNIDGGFTTEAVQSLTGAPTAYF